MSDVHVRLQNDLNAARKTQDKALTLLLGTILADIKNRRIELRREPTDDDVMDVLRKGIKRRRESLEMYEKGGRTDLAAQERSEIAALEQYLPAQASEDDIRAAIRAAIDGGANAIGPVMGKVTPQFKGRADGSVISRIVKEELAGRA